MCGDCGCSPWDGSNKCPGCATLIPEAPPKPVKTYDVPFPKIGSYVELDGGKWAARLGPSNWKCAEFRLPSDAFRRVYGESHPGIACNVAVTGRTLQKRGGEYWVRVRVRFVGDGEPDTVVYGWLKAE